MNSIKKQTFGWIFYDWANSAFPTVIITFVFSVYFSRGMIGNETEGAALWSFAIAASGFAVAFLAPLCGVMADQGGRLKRPIVICVVIYAAMTCVMWFGVPGADTVTILLVLAALVFANIAFELSLVFYNALLPRISSPATMGRISGISWGLGYVGGLGCLVLVLVLLIGLGPLEPLITMPQDNSEHIRASVFLTALWVVLFSLPFFFFVRETGTARLKLKEGLRQLWQSILALKGNRNFLTFLIASALYRDGLVTLFTIGGVYAASTYDMDFQEILIFAIGLNVSSGLGAILFAFIDDRIGSKRTIVMSLCGLIAVGVAILFTTDKTVFLMLSLVLGIFIGPVQSASRTMVSRMMPEDTITQSYGFYAFTGKSIAFLGPLAFGWATLAFGSQQAGLMTIIAFWIAGLLLLLKVGEN